MRHKIRQHLGMALIITVGIGMISHFLWFDAIYAGGQTDLLQDLQNKLNTANIIMNVIYILLRPGLILAGMALDNNMVYGTFFKLDAPLWVIWNIIKNFANFTLWFMVLVEVIKMVFSFDDHAMEKVTGVIKHCIIAGIGIQASWFLLAATIDLSTVATYGIGWLPLSVLWTSQDATIKCLADKKILGVSSTMDFTNSSQNGVANQGFTYYYYIDAQGGRKNYSPCELKDNYVIGRQYGWPGSTTPPTNRNTGTVFTQPNFCILGASKVVRFKGEIAFDTLPPYTSVDPNSMTPTQYKQSLLNRIPAIAATGTYTRSWLEQSQKVFDINNPASLDVSDGWGIAPLYAIPQNPARSTFNETGVLTMKNLLDSTKGMMWPLITLYSSILNFAQFNIQTSNGDDRALVIEAIIKTLLALALFLPILLTALVMFVRVWILWAVIALSPFFVLKRSFHDSIGEALHEVPLLKYEIGDLLKIIFAPVVIVFAVSLCIIFMSLLTNWFSNRGNWTVCAPNTKEMYRTTFDVDEYIYATGQTLKVGNLFEISNQAFGNSTGGDARDYIGWILVNLFGIWVVWMILMAALSFSKDLWDVVGVKKIGDWATNTVWSIPFIPVPVQTGDGMDVWLVWANKFKSISTGALDKKVQGMQLDSQVAKWFDEWATGNKADNGTTGGSTTTTTPAAVTNTTLTTNNITDIDDAISNGTPISQIRDNILKKNSKATVADIDTHIAESIAKLAADGTKTLTDKSSVNKTIENFKTASKTMTTAQIKTIFDDPDSKLKYVLAPKLELGKSQNIKFNDKAWGTFTRKEDGEISLTDVKEDVSAADQASYIEIDKDITRKTVEDFLKDLEEQINKNTSHKTNLEKIKSFYPTT